MPAGISEVGDARRLDGVEVRSRRRRIGRLPAREKGDARGAPGAVLRMRGGSRPPGATLVVHGDGTRERQLSGPATAGGRRELGTVRVQRFECERCAR